MSRKWEGCLVSAQIENQLGLIEFQVFTLEGDKNKSYTIFHVSLGFNFRVINGDTFSPGDVPDPDAIKMFVGQIPKHLSESELKTLFEEFGRVFQINVLRDKVSKQSKGKHDYFPLN